MVYSTASSRKRPTLVTSIILLVLMAADTVLAEEKSAGGPPPFFLQDPTDSLCLGGEEFKRCSIDTLFYVVGSPGSYQIHKRPTSAGKVDSEEDDGLCLAKKQCTTEADVSPAKLAKCSHCGAKLWNILGDADTGYVLTFGEATEAVAGKNAASGKFCLVREKGTTKSLIAPCDDPDHPYTALQLHFASASDITTMSSPGARMIGAASDGDLKAIQDMLHKDKVDVNVRDWDELTALIPAASGGHLEICKLLVKEGIDVNAKDKDGITALMEASIMGQTKIVEFLLEAGAEVDAGANSDVSALWLAASEGQTDVVKLLLGRGASASNTRVDGISALMTASVGGHEGAVKLLLENGADPSVADKDGLTSLMNAAESGNVAVIKLLVQSLKDPSDLNKVSNSGFTALIIAAAHGHADAVEFLIDAGCSVDSTSENQVTALMYAAASNHVGCLRALLEKGKATIDLRHTNGGTALLEAATGGAVDTMKILIEHGARVDFFDNDGVTPLMAIASQGRFEGQALVIDSLRKALNDEQLRHHINQLSYSGGSAVMFSAAGGHVECTKHLIELGADVKAIARATTEYLAKLEEMAKAGTLNEDDPHVDGVTALHVAAQGGHIGVVDLLLENGADVMVKDDQQRTALILAIKGDHREVASALVRAGADPNTQYIDDTGVAHNLLFDAIVAENEEFAKILIENGANIYYADEKKVTILLQACHRGYVDIVTMLLAKHLQAGDNADFIEAASMESVTPIIAASSEGHAEITAALIAAGANPSTTDSDGTSALMAASARGNLEVVRELLKAGAAVNDQNNDGHTALMFAYNGKNQVETLWERYRQYADGSESNDDSNTGGIIKKALDDHMELINLLLQGGADPKLKDKEGHTAKDFDYHPDADSEVLEKQARAEKVRDESKNEL